MSARSAQLAARGQTLLQHRPRRRHVRCSSTAHDPDGDVHGPLREENRSLVLQQRLDGAAHLRAPWRHLGQGEPPAALRGDELQARHLQDWVGVERGPQRGQGCVIDDGGVRALQQCHVDDRGVRDCAAGERGCLHELGRPAVKGDAGRHEAQLAASGPPDLVVALHQGSRAHEPARAAGNAHRCARVRYERVATLARLAARSNDSRLGLKPRHILGLAAFQGPLQPALETHPGEGLRWVQDVGVGLAPDAPFAGFRM
mmetsp:Transcript_45661/g.111180  ORF Transcript_45661/g.111180 Transcript_45661/m.111180 type:complete len:258 (-) Transcript_45661:75-848(-)